MRNSIKPLVFLTASVLALPAWADAPKIGMQGWLFTPKEVTVNAGERVTWINDDDSHHLILFDRPEIKNSPDLKPEKEYSVVIDQPGEYPYSCKYHKDYGMVGKLVVKAAAK